MKEQLYIVAMMASNILANNVEMEVQESVDLAMDIMNIVEATADYESTLAEEH